jgi:tubulin gamma
MAPNLINISVGQCGIGLGLEWLQSLCEEHGIGPDGYSNAQIDLAQDNKDIFFYQVGF